MNVTRVKKKIALYAGLLAVFIAIIALSYSRFLDSYELETLDIRFRLRPTLQVKKNIVIIEIADDTIDKIGKWPFSRRYHATLVEALTEAGAQAIVFDIFFSEDSDPTADRLFEEAIKKSGIVYLPYIFNIKEEGRKDVPVADKLQEAILDRFESFAKGAGFINIIPDVDGKFRRVPPIIRYQNIGYPHVCFLVAANYMGKKQDDIKITPGRYVKMGEDQKIPLDSDSNIIVNFPGRWQDTFRHYSYIDIIESYMSDKFPEVTGKEAILDLTSLQDSVCFIGVTATAAPDVHPSPFDSMYPGVGVNASLFNSFLIGKFIARATRSTNAAILVFLSLLLFFVSKRAKTLVGFLFVFLLTAAYVLLAVLLFIFFGLWIDVFCPFVVMVFLYLGITFTRYMGEMRGRELLEKELAIAKRIQESFLPQEIPATHSIQVAASMQTAKQVGGDLYDLVKISPEKLGVMIGDVSGKGVPAALYMAKVVSEFRTYMGLSNPKEIVTKLNSRLVKEGSAGLFVTLTYAIFDEKNSLLLYASGGHLPIIMLKKDKSEPILLDAKEGTPLGLFDGEFSAEEARFGKGDMFVMYTDGVTEAMNPKAEMFGSSRLADLVALGADGLLDRVVAQSAGDVLPKSLFGTLGTGHSLGSAWI